MITVGVNGALGRMGSRIIDLMQKDSELRLGLALEQPDAQGLGEDVGTLLKSAPLGVELKSEIGPDDAVDVLIDFSSPQSTIVRAKECLQKGVAMVTGTTGLSEEQIAELKEASKKIALLVAPNMSLGVNLLFKFASQIARALGDEYDIEIVESHHRFKKDAPSGTALKIAGEIAKATGRDFTTDVIYGREGKTGEKPTRQIGIHAVRTGDVVGEHTVIYSTLGERIELTHKAHSRDTFVYGALKAAKFLAGKPHGFYSINDVLGL